MAAFATETNHAGGHIVDEQSINYCRDTVRLASGNDLQAGAVLGQVANANTVAADAGNTGNADLSGVTVTLGPGAINGTYTLTCTAAATDAGTFSVTEPNGGSLADLTVGVAYLSAHINLTIPDGATDWAEGDVITIDVVLGEYSELAPAASDGTETASAVLFDAVDASTAEQDAVVSKRVTVVNQAELVWPTGITEAQKATALGQLKTAGIIAR